LIWRFANLFGAGIRAAMDNLLGQFKPLVLA